MYKNMNPLLLQVYEASFAVDDVVLYLDTHPCDQNALAYFQEADAKRQEAMAAYSAKYGPLMIDEVGCTDQWTWQQGPWPWEGGCN